MWYFVSEGKKKSNSEKIYGSLNKMKALTVNRVLKHHKTEKDNSVLKVAILSAL